MRETSAPRIPSPRRCRRPYPVCALAAATVLACLSVGPVPLEAAEASRADRRAITVESTLKDLSQSNDAALRRGHVTALPGKDAAGKPRTDLVVEPPPDAPDLVQGEVQSSLHKLRRETAHRQTADGRKARVNDTLDRSADDPAADR